VFNTTVKGVPMHRTVSPIALPCVIGGVGLWGIAAATTSTTTPTKTSTAATAAPAAATTATTAAITSTRRPLSEQLPNLDSAGRSAAVSAGSAASMQRT
jgi:hypothetical protein